MAGTGRSIENALERRQARESQVALDHWLPSPAEPELEGGTTLRNFNRVGVTRGDSGWQGSFVDELARFESIICKKTVAKLPKLLLSGFAQTNKIFLQTVKYVSAETRIDQKGFPGQFFAWHLTVNFFGNSLQNVSMSGGAEGPVRGGGFNRMVSIASIADHHTTSR